MFFLSGYVLSIVGIVIIGVIVELMLVDGQVKKYVQSIYVLFVIFTIIAPIPTFINNLKNSKFEIETSTIQIDTKYLDVIKNQKDATIKNLITKAFADEGYEGIEIEINSAMVDKVYEIQSICVNTTQCPESISRKITVKIVTKVVDINEKDIIIYE